MAVAMRDLVAARLNPKWDDHGYDLGFGIGVASGFATLGVIGFEGRKDYAAIGTVTNTAARLCGEAKPMQILIAHRLLPKLDGLVETEPVGELELKGLTRPVKAYNIVRVKD